jgi:tetratricopeptide (TPR) repeat protein
MADERLRMATELMQKAYKAQMQGKLELAISLYKRSISLHPTAEAHTFLGWTYRFQDKLEEAIEECKKAIAVDPTFGNPYNDIGAYLIEQGKHAEAIPWLEKATVSSRYESYHYAWFNLGRAYEHQEWLRKARECFEQALEIEPEYKPAQEALENVRRMIQ